MAVSGRLGKQLLSLKRLFPNARCFTTGSKQIISFPHNKLAGLTLAAVVGGFIAYKKSGNSTLWPNFQPRPFGVVHANESESESCKEEKIDKDAIPSQREKRFNLFASLEYEGFPYMTPRDFLESITNEQPRVRSSRSHLQKGDIEKYLKNTPPRKKASARLFRNLNDQGLISYTEYLFLLCVLTKPKSGFEIAFNMFDLDGDQKVDKKEFLVLEKLLARTSSTGIESTQDLSQAISANVPQQIRRFQSIQNTDCISNADHSNIRMNIWALLNEVPNNASQSSTDTTLTVHFFGTKGKDVLNYDDFHRFMENLQTEVLELEFAEFSHGMLTIKEEEFAKILLRYTVLTPEEHDDYISRLRSRIKHASGITFKEFKDFCQFLNNIDDFALAMRIYTYAEQPITETDFNRAVKACTGQNLSTNVVHVVFQLFDNDGDEKLSHKEFISVMKERLHRGAKTPSKNKFENFKICVKNEMKHT